LRQGFYLQRAASEAAIVNQERRMSRILLQLGVGMLVAGLAGSAAYAEGVEGVTVEGTRIVTKDVGRTAQLVPVVQVSLSYTVTYSDLDLNTSGGQATLQKRVDEAARAACREISRVYPNAGPDDYTCAKIAARDALAKVKGLSSE
jgi:UrcA family protein